MTGLITLVAAISAFYFGSGSLGAAVQATGAGGRRRKTGGGLLVLRPSTPFALTKTAAGGFDPVAIELGGTALATASVAAAIVSNDTTGTVGPGSHGQQLRLHARCPHRPRHLEVHGEGRLWRVFRHLDQRALRRGSTVSRHLDASSLPRVRASPMS